MTTTTVKGRELFTPSALELAAACLASAIAVAVIMPVSLITFALVAFFLITSGVFCDRVENPS